MPRRKAKLVKQNGRRRGQRRVPGWGGVVGRGLGMVQKTFTTKGSVAHKALRLARKVANMVNVEYKYYDIVSAATAISYTGTLGTMNIIPQGTAESQRIGDSLKMQNATLRFNLQRTTADCFARVMLVWDKQNSTASPGDILHLTGTVNSTQSPKSYDRRFQTQILYDKVFNLNANHPQQYEDIVVAIDQHTQYAAGTTTPDTGAFKLLLISNLAAGATTPNINYYLRMTYTDD